MTFNKDFYGLMPQFMLVSFNTKQPMDINKVCTILVKLSTM